MTVDLPITGTSRDAQQAVAALEQKFDKLVGGLKQVKVAQQRQSKEAVKGVGEQIRSVAKMALGYMGAQKAVAAFSRGIRAAVGKNRELSAAIDEVLAKLPEKELKFQIQSGFDDVDLEEKIRRVRPILLDTPTTDLSGALDIERQLASSGFRREDRDSGDALKTVLELQAATNQFGDNGGGDVAEGVKFIAQFLKAQGAENPTAQQIRGTGGRLTQLFEGSDIQFQDLNELAGVSAGLTAKGISEELQLAVFSAIRDVKGAAEGATGFRQVSTRLRGAANSKDKTKALAEIGLQPEDVDFIGESFDVALKRLRDGLASVNEETASRVKLSLFGEKGAEAGDILLGKADLIQKRVAIQQGDAFGRNVDRFRGSRTAERNRVGIRKEFAARDLDVERGVTFDEVRKELAALQIELSKGNSLGGRNALSGQAAAASAALAAGEGLGMTPLEAMRRPGLSGGVIPFAESDDKLADELRRRTIRKAFQRGGIAPFATEEAFQGVADRKQAAALIDAGVEGSVKELVEEMKKHRQELEANRKQQGNRPKVTIRRDRNKGIED